MLGWGNYPSKMFGGYHEGSDEIMLALYKLNEVIYEAIVVYPNLMYNQEAQEYEYKKNSFMTFNPSHKSKYDKPYGESGYYIAGLKSEILKYKNIFQIISLIIITAYDLYTLRHKSGIFDSFLLYHFQFKLYLSKMSIQAACNSFLVHCTVMSHGHIMNILRTYFFLIDFIS